MEGQFWPQGRSFTSLRFVQDDMVAVRFGQGSAVPFLLGGGALRARECGTFFASKKGTALLQSGAPGFTGWQSGRGGVLRGDGEIAASLRSSQ
jgi:hypothetical protein